MRLLLPGLLMLTSVAYAQQCGLTPREQDLWTRTVTPLLREALWKPTLLYDAAHVLMLPLHFSFASNDPERQREFSVLAERFAQDKLATPDSGTLNRVQFLYLFSQYLVLRQQQAPLAGADQKLSTALAAEVQHLWSSEPVPWYGGKHASRAERLRWRITTPTPARKYYRLMPDEDMFILALASDLYRTQTGAYRTWYTTQVAPLLGQALHEFLTLTPQGGVVFKPGVWSDHPDMAYAGHTAKGPALTPLPRAEVTLDSSHAHRYPLWLRSFRALGEVRPTERAFLNRLERALARQLLTKMYQAPTAARPYPVLSNYMDGWNGLYRWNYATVGKGNGYGPGELSGTFLLGWWAGATHVGRK